MGKPVHSLTTLSSAQLAASTVPRVATPRFGSPHSLPARPRHERVQLTGLDLAMHLMLGKPHRSISSVRCTHRLQALQFLGLPHAMPNSLKRG